MDELMTTAEVAAASRRHPQNVLLAARRGLLTSQQASASAKRFYRPADVADWIGRGAPYKPPAARRLRAAS